MYKSSQDVYFVVPSKVRIFAIQFLKSPILPENFPNCVGYHCSNYTVAGEGLVHLLSDLSRYYCFGETLLMPS